MMAGTMAITIGNSPLQWATRFTQAFGTIYMCMAVLEVMRDMDVRSLLPRIAVPTLVLHRTGDRAVRIEAGRHLSALIRTARFIELPGNDHWIWVGDQARAIEEIRDYIQTHIGRN